MPLLFSTLFSSGAGAPPPEPPKVAVSFVDGVSLPNQSSNASRTLTLDAHQPGDMLVALTSNRGVYTQPGLLPGYTDVVSDVDGSGASIYHRGYRLQVKIATSASETISWNGAYGFLIALRGGQYVGRVARSSWKSVEPNWAVPPLYDLDASGVGFLLSGYIGGEGLPSVVAPYQLLEPASTTRRFASFLEQNESERVTDGRMNPSTTWNTVYWAAEFLPFPPGEVVLPAGAWRLDGSRVQSGYALWSAGQTVVNAKGGKDLQGFVPTENSFTSGKRYWEVQCAAEFAAGGNYNGYMAIVSAEHLEKWAGSNPLSYGSMGYRGDGSLWSGEAVSAAQVAGGLAPYGKNAVLMFAFDPATRGLWVGKDGVWAKNPDTDPPVYASGVGSVWYPAIQGRDPNEGGTLRSLSSQFSYPVPASCIPLG